MIRYTTLLGRKRKLQLVRCTSWLRSSSSKALRSESNSFLFAHLPESVRIVEVGPRDGLQNEQQQIPTHTKVKLIDMLTEAGLKAVETTSFVSPKAVPQLADAADVMKGIKTAPGVRYPVLVPNMKGLDRALETGVKEIAVFGAATETFSRRNLGCSMQESMQRYGGIAEKASKFGLDVRGYISCVLGCPYEGAVDVRGVAEMACRLRDFGCYEVSLGDTIGTGTPFALHRLLQECRKQGLAPQQLAVHLHDTYGQAIANLTLALQHGIAVFDSSLAGLGGCPFAPGATGNVATEDCLYLLDGLGIEHGVNAAKLRLASDFILSELGRPTGSRAGKATAAAHAARASPAAK